MKIVSRYIVVMVGNYVPYELLINLEKMLIFNPNGNYALVAIALRDSWGWNGTFYLGN
ncbi:MAG: hypothetical protein ACFCU5_04820 [Pleurocapsa sp.]